MNNRTSFSLFNLLMLQKCDFSLKVKSLSWPLCLQDVSGMSLSMLAAAGGHDDILRLLIRKGVRVNNRQKNGTTALMHAAEKVRRPLASNPLHWCLDCDLVPFQFLLWIIFQNFLTTVAILLEAGSYVNAQTLGGETALMKVMILHLSSKNVLMS